MEYINLAHNINMRINIIFDMNCAKCELYLLRLLIRLIGKTFWVVEEVRDLNLTGEEFGLHLCNI